ncbi:unnamed protein product [Anisakis simplex]|uniref:CSRNP_N domain-containing protein n=1 Tax=Anisakis simplex TaxID=6269 RepID=A0A0M3JD58_ANISI|nr:unnamed protein product [Anisakis simplex]
MEKKLSETLAGHLVENRMGRMDYRKIICLKIKVDRPSFPCPCSSASCSNPEGRVEFNAVRVRAHYLETMMRIQVLESNYNFDGVNHLACLFRILLEFKDTFVDDLLLYSACEDVELLSLII